MGLKIACANDRCAEEHVHVEGARGSGAHLWRIGLTFVRGVGRDSRGSYLHVEVVKPSGESVITTAAGPAFLRNVGEAAAKTLRRARRRKAARLSG